MVVGDPIEELKSTELFKYLELIDKEYSQNVKLFVSGIAPILKSIEFYFPYYTRHDAHHGFRVCNRIYQIIKPHCLQKTSDQSYNAAEVFLLIAAAYAHDLGMAVFPNEEDTLSIEIGIKKEELYTTKMSLLQNHLRTYHSTRGKKYITDNASKLGLKPNLISLLSDMMKSHNLSIKEFNQQLSFPASAQDKEIFINQLSAILCIADLLEFSAERANDEAIKSLENTSSESELKSLRENMKHKGIMDSVAISNEGLIIFSGTFNDPYVLNIAHNNVDYIEKWVRDYYEIDRKTRIPQLKIIPSRLDPHFIYTGGDFHRLGVRINKTKIIELISSNSIWEQDLGLPIKELLQNSVEACRYRNHNKISSSRYCPKITVEFHRESHSIKIADNGCGMSKDVILFNFLNIANSRSKEVGYCTNDFESMSRFGIGFWSVFTIADKVEVSTAPFESLIRNDEIEKIKGVEFEVSNKELKDFTVLKEIRHHSGTTIKLHLTSNVTIDNIFENLKKHVISPEVEVNIIFDGATCVLSNILPEIDDQYIFGSKRYFKDQFSILVFTNEVSSKNNDIQLKIKFLYRVIDGHATFMLDGNKSLLVATDSLFFKSRIYVCGFKVTIQPLLPLKLCFDLERIGTYLANKISPKGIEYSIDRNKVTDNDSLKEYLLNVKILIHTAYREFLKSTNSYSPKIIYELNNQSFLHGGEIYDRYTEDQFKIASQNYPDILCFKLYKVEKGEAIKSVTPKYIDLSSLLKEPCTIWTIQNKYVDFNKVYGEDHFISNEALASIAYDYVNSKHDYSGSHYIMEANIPGSILFDNDPKSTVDFIISKEHLFCIQKIHIHEINDELAIKNIYSGISGRWAGAIYFKEFSTPNKYPFIFLGQGRVLILENSKLCNEIKKLYNEKKLVSLSKLIYQLQEKENGIQVFDLHELLF